MEKHKISKLKIATAYMLTLVMLFFVIVPVVAQTTEALEADNSESEIWDDIFSILADEDEELSIVAFEDFFDELSEILQDIDAPYFHALSLNFAINMPVPEIPDIIIEQAQSMTASSDIIDTITINGRKLRNAHYVYLGGDRHDVFDTFGNFYNAFRHQRRGRPRRSDRNTGVVAYTLHWINVDARVNTPVEVINLIYTRDEDPWLEQMLLSDFMAMFGLQDQFRHLDVRVRNRVFFAPIRETTLKHEKPISTTN